MTQHNLRGAYYCPTHDYKEDWEWLAAWQPNVIRLMLEGKPENPDSFDVGQIKRVHDTCPNATLLLRCWDVDDRNFAAHDAMVADPKGEAERQVNWWAKVFDNAVAAGVPRQSLMAGLNNETGPDKDSSLYPYTEHALTIATPKGIRLGALVFSNGRPSLPGEAEWTTESFAKLDDLIIANNGARLLHEYMQPEGMYAVWTDRTGKERHDWTYLMGRNTRWPVNPNVAVIIAEWGLNGIIYNRHPDPKYGDSGWTNFKEWPPSRYADEYVECVRQASPNVIGICPYIEDWKDHKWQSFDLRSAYSEFLKRKDLCVKEIADTPPVTVHLPVIGNGPVSPEEPVPSSDCWTRSIDFVLAHEGGYQNNPADIGNWTGGAQGAGENKGTNFGISAASYPNLDIVNLTREQAIAIYQRDYWIPSGASALAWPACLIAFDTAVLHGVGTAQTWIAQVGTNPLAIAAKRLNVYTKLNNGDVFWRGWTNRVVDLLNVASQV